MEPDPDPESKAAALHALAAGPLAASAATLSARARALPSGKDFHFFHSFPDFKSPARAIVQTSDSALRSIASASPLWAGRPPPAPPADTDDSYDWLVNLNDELLERFAISMDEFKTVREKEEASGVKKLSKEDFEAGFQLVCGRNNKKNDDVADYGDEVLASGGGYAGVRMATKDKKTTAARSKVPFHIPSITRPQQEFNILVNNKNQPFDHVWLERSEDGSRVVHPLEKVSLLDFIDRTVAEGDPIKPLPLEDTRFELVAGVKDLKELASKLRAAEEFAVDLEHNQYRSFQGLTCLMQISTRTEDFIIDTLKLRVHVGPYLREVFKDPTKRKVMHGADRDILWLQRDFGIYVCNLFDTGQASRVMQLERNSLEYLLHHFCEVNANKEYQNADWRLRPLPEEMIKYAREDTHYLLHIYDLMRNRLLLASSPENDLLLEVYKRSYGVCMQLYEKELLTDTSYLYIYGLQEADFDAKQLAIVFGLCEWRDKIAREEDESTGYILPNKALIEIARHMPVSSGKLRRLVRSKHPYIERHLNSVIGIIRSSIENSSPFESVSEQIKKGHHESAMENIEEVGFNSESFRITEDLMESSTGARDVLDGPSSSVQNAEHNTTSLVALDNDAMSATTEVLSGQISLAGRYQHEEKLQTTPIFEVQRSFELSSTDRVPEKEKVDYETLESSVSTKKVSIPSVQISKKQSSAFGVLWGNSSSRRKLNPYNGGTMERDKNVSMVEHIKSTVSLPFHSFATASGPISKPTVTHPQPETPKKWLGQPGETTKLDDVIPLHNESDGSQSHEESPKGDGDPKHRQWFPRTQENGTANSSRPEAEMEECPMSSDLPSSFQECFQSINERKGSTANQRPHREVESSFPLKPFDYAAARKNVMFEQVVEDGEAEGDNGLETHMGSRERRRGLTSGRSNGEERSGGFKPARRRQAFPMSGNRSMTYN